jgi:NTE family protein
MHKAAALQPAALEQEPRGREPVSQRSYPLLSGRRIKAGGMRVGAVNVGTGIFAYFDTTTDRISPEHIMASGSLPLGFASTEVDGEFY